MSPGAYRVELTPAAVRQLGKLDRAVQLRVRAAIDLLSEDPRPPRATKLVGGDGEWRVRTGDFRIIYQIDDGVLLVLVLALGHRRDVYRR